MNAKRAYIRSVFAFIEGSVWTLKQTALNNKSANTLLMEAEIAMLSDKVYELNGTGEIKLEIDTICDDWNHFQKSIKVRNRITHPKNSSAKVCYVTMNRKIKIAFATALTLITGYISAAESPPYKGEETRQIKALSESDITGLLAGKGMGYGKAAELNGYPGPKHVLELRKELSLTPDQQKKTETLFALMEASAKSLGAELIAAERELDQAFANKKIDAATLAELVNKIGQIESQLRTAHLNAHLQQVKVLNEKQIALYMTLRGYNGADGHGAHHHHHRK
jgi:Spy/CpxP family protein refolding chaperone